MKSMSEQLEDLQIDLGLLRNRVIENSAALEILKQVIIGIKAETSGMDREDIKAFIDNEIQTLVDKIQGKSG